MQRLLVIDQIPSDDWGDILWHLAKHTAQGRIVVAFDEINWIGSLDHTFLGKLKSAWDLNFKSNPHLLLFLSGSMSSWIDKNILNSTGFMGRVSLELTLEELPLSTCNLFWQKKGQHVAPYDKFKVLSVTGGVPRYLEEIDPSISAEKNIFNLAFRRGGLLVEEFDRIFSDLFLKSSKRYKEIIERLADGSASFDQICRHISLEKGGIISSCLEDLVEIGYVSRDYSWNLATGKESRIAKFRLKDNYLRFYLNYIEPVRPLIEKNLIKTLPAWSTIMGYQFENLVLSNAHQLYELLCIDPQTLVNANPYYQRATEAKRGCQIDYLIQDKFNTLYLCEIKFSNKPIGLRVINAVQEKIKYFSRPKCFSVRPVLIHVNGVTDAVVKSAFFSNIINFSEFL